MLLTGWSPIANLLTHNCMWFDSYLLGATAYGVWWQKSALNTRTGYCVPCSYDPLAYYKLWVFSVCLACLLFASYLRFNLCLLWIIWIMQRSLFSFFHSFFFLLSSLFLCCCFCVVLMLLFCARVCVFVAAVLYRCILLEFVLVKWTNNKCFCFMILDFLCV